MSVLHVDLDQFLAAVEVLRRPELAGLPVVVGGRGDPTERGVVSTASYEAREFGIRSGLPLKIAVRRCPQAVFLPVDAPAYDAASAVVMETLRASELDRVGARYADLDPRQLEMIDAVTRGVVAKLLHQRARADVSV